MLEAARACVLAVGVRRTTFSDVARRLEHRLFGGFELVTL